MGKKETKKDKVLCHTDVLNLVIIGLFFITIISLIIFHGIRYANPYEMILALLLMFIPVFFPVFAHVERDKITFYYLIRKRFIKNEQILNIESNRAYHESANIKIYYTKAGKEQTIVLPIGSNRKRQVKALEKLAEKNFDKINTASFGENITIENGKFKIKT